ncbi:MAG: hypothetical protein GXP55_04440 [Deltaproteobacteria bacterium]|nr:hypothetical protein [Deltaproteobacteria bacterium]
MPSRYPIASALLLSILTLASVPSLARGQAPVTSLDAARRGLATYDLEGERTLDVIRGLGRLLEHPPGLREAREATFLRDMASADLLVLVPTSAMRTRVSAALGVPTAQVLAWLQADLRRAAVGPYAPAAHQGLDALRLRAATSPDYAHGRGPRRDALLLSAVAQALEEANVVEALAALGTDPCADADAACASPYSHFSAAGRRAISALRDARACVGHLGEAATGGDPFARAAAPKLPAIVAALDALVLTPTPRLPGDVRLPQVSHARAEADFDAVLLIAGRELRLGYAAHAHVQADGEVALEPSDRPLLPETRSFRLPTGYRPVVRAIPGLVRALPQASEGTRVALGVAPDVPAHVMSRVFLSARARGLEPSVLLASAGDGSLRAMAFHGILAGERPPATDLRVHVRLGGYAVASSTGGTVSLPRVRGDAGLHFDTEGLSHLVGQRQPRSASLRFMSVVDSGPVLLAAFGLSPAGDSLTVVMP